MDTQIRIQYLPYLNRDQDDKITFGTADKKHNVITFFKKAVTF